MRPHLSAVRIYIVAAGVTLPAPCLMPLADLLPSAPDRMVVWPVVAFASAPLAVIAVLLGALHHVHRLTGPAFRNVAWVWSTAAFLAVVPLALWFPRGPTGYFVAIGFQALAAGLAAVGLVWLAQRLWQRRPPGRWLAVIGVSQLALLLAIVAYRFARQFVSGGVTTLDEISETLVSFAFDCALAAVVLSSAVAVGWSHRRSPESPAG